MSDFEFPEPQDDKIPAHWAKSPPWKDDPDLDDLIKIMEPLERDYWSEGGQSLGERQEFLARIEARWRRWKDLARQQHRASKDRKPPAKPKPARKPAVNASELDTRWRSPRVRKWIEEQKLAGRVFKNDDELNSALLVALGEKIEQVYQSTKEAVAGLPPRPASEPLRRTPVKHGPAETPSTARTVWAFIRKFAAFGGAFLLGASWTMLQIDEYGLALLLLLLGLGGLSIQIYDWKGFEGHSKATGFLKSVAVVLILFSLVFFSAVIVKRKQGRSWSNLLEQDKTRAAEPKREETPPVSVKQDKRILLHKTPRQLLEIYEKGNTELQADQLMDPFKGQWIRVTGKIASLSPLESGVSILLDVQEKNHTDRVAANVPVKDPEERKKFMRLAVGDAITIEGQIAKEQSGQFLYLVKAEYIEP